MDGQSWQCPGQLVVVTAIAARRQRTISNTAEHTAGGYSGSDQTSVTATVFDNDLPKIVVEPD